MLQMAILDRASHYLNAMKFVNS